MLGGAGMGARRLGEQALGPWGDKGHLAAHTLSWGQACWNNWLDSSRDGGQSWGCSRGTRPSPLWPPQPPNPGLGSPLPWWTVQADKASPGRCPPHLFLPLDQSHWADTPSPVALPGLAANSCPLLQEPQPLQVWKDN